MQLYTIGHGTRSSEELVAALAAAGVGRLVDVRRYPGSRRNPQFSRDELAEALPASGVGYEWWGEELGGRRRSPGKTGSGTAAGGTGASPGVSRHPAWQDPAFRAYADYMDTPAFREALVRLTGSLDTAPPAAVMCAETLWWRCHRRLIADAATMRGVEVVHILGPQKTEPHRLNPAARRGDDGWPVYDVGVDRPLVR